jgi:hypothetical protein
MFPAKNRSFPSHFGGFGKMDQVSHPKSGKHPVLH